LRHSCRCRRLTSDVARAPNHPQARPHDALLLAQTLGRLSVSRRLG
jgi:hypothetical protein